MRNAKVLLGAVVCLTLLTGRGQAATYQVNTPDDHNDGVCDSDCSLRDAVEVSNADTTADIIELPAGLYVLDKTAANENANQTGDLDVTKSLTILGAGAASTTINGFGADRIFHVPSGNVSLTLQGLTLTGGNMPTGEAGAIGFYSTGQLNISECDLLGNHAGTAGAIVAVDSGVNIENSEISFNSSDDLGGGVLFLDSDVHIAGSTFVNNTTQNGGGVEIGASSDSSTALIEDSTFAGNTFVSLGFGDFRLQNVTITGGFGGIGLSFGTGAFANVTVLGNVDTDFSFNAFEVEIANSILGTATCFNSDIASQGYNLVEDVGSCAWTAAAGDQLSADPQLGALADNGGPTWTLLPQAGSPAIDGGNPAGCLDVEGNPLNADQRGVARPQGAACDIGAVEFQESDVPGPTPSPTPTPDDDGGEIEGDGGCSLAPKASLPTGSLAIFGLGLFLAGIFRGLAVNRK